MVLVIGANVTEMGRPDSEQQKNKSSEPQHRAFSRKYGETFKIKVRDAQYELQEKS